MNPDSFGKGAIKDIADKRDFSYSDIAGSVPQFDWNVGYDVEKEIGISLPVKNQGASLSCGGQAWSTYGNVLTTIFDKKLNDRSARFIYSQTYVDGGGSAGRDNSEIAVNQGWGRESLVSSMEGQNTPTEAFMRLKSDITDDIRKDAALDKALSYAVVNTDIEEIARAIRDNHGCIIGISGQNNGTWLSAFPQPPQSVSWRHWIYVGKAKIIDGKRYIGGLNSWGESTGEKGWQWISEDYFSALNGSAIFSAWTIMMNALLKHTFNLPMKYGMKNGEVMFLQMCLQNLGIFPKEQECTGYFGNITQAAVFEFQKRYVIKDSWSWLKVWTNMGRNVGVLTLPALNKIFA